MLKRILFFFGVLLFTGTLCAEKNPLIREGEHIIDIGKNGTRYIQVPLETIFYTPDMKFINNILVYSLRDTLIEDCYTDKYNHENCPLDEQECTGKTEYSQGSTSSKGTGYISCATLDSLSYWDNTRNKCVLPSEVATVCKDYKGSKYDGNRDKCVTGTTYAPTEGWGFRIPEIEIWSLKGNVMVWNTVGPVSYACAHYDEYVTSNGELTIKNGITTQSIYKNVSLVKVGIDTLAELNCLDHEGGGLLQGDGTVGVVSRAVYIKALETNYFTGFKKDQEIYTGSFGSGWRIGIYFDHIDSDGKLFVKRFIKYDTQPSPNGLVPYWSGIKGKPTGTQGKLLTWGVKAKAALLQNTLLQDTFLCASYGKDIASDGKLQLPYSVGDVYKYTNASLQEITLDILTTLECLDTQGSTILHGIGTVGVVSRAVYIKALETNYFTGFKKDQEIYTGSFGSGWRIGIYFDHIDSDGKLFVKRFIKYDTQPSPNGLVPYWSGIQAQKSYYCKDNLVWNNGNPYCTSEKLYAPKCSNPLFPTRQKSECLGDKKKYDFYNYKCDDSTNVYGNKWSIIEQGGDCGEYSLRIDTDGDGIKDRCNSPTPPNNNCHRINYSCPIDSNKICSQKEVVADYNDFYKWSVVNPLNRATSSDWEIINKNTTIQHKNGDPTFFLSNYSLGKEGKLTFAGTFRTDDKVDNDWFGFVWGYKDVKNSYILDWSRWKNDEWSKEVYSGKVINEGLNEGKPFVDPMTGGSNPLTLFQLKNYSWNNMTQYWKHLDHETGYKVLKRANNGGWSPHQDYNIKIEITNHDVKVWIGKVGSKLTLDLHYTTTTPMDLSGKLGFYNYSISNVTYRDFTIMWEDGKEVKTKLKRPLVEFATFDGNFKGGEYGLFKNEKCADTGKKCLYGLSSITSNGNKLCLKDKMGNNQCINTIGSCTFSGSINDIQVDNKLLFSFLNSPDDDVDVKIYDYKKDFSSPTLISLDFNDATNSYYPTKQVKYNPKTGDQITVDFWMYWKGWSDEHGMMPLGFQIYDLWLYPSHDSFGFNTGMGDSFGIEGALDKLANRWVKVTAVFTHKDLKKNKLYIDGVEQTLQVGHNGRVLNNANALIDQIFLLGSWNRNTVYTFNGKIAGINVYDGALDAREVKSLYDGGSMRGVNFLQVHKNKIDGYNSNKEHVGTITVDCGGINKNILSGKVGHKEVEGQESIIVSAKVENNRLMFWNPYSSNGYIGHIEFMKAVSDSDVKEGFEHEPTDLWNLYEASNFSGFIARNGKTYAVSNDAITSKVCQDRLKDTSWYLAQRDNDDLESIKTINGLSFYTNGSFGEHCVIAKNNDVDNQLAKYGVKETIKEKVLTSFYCSPYGCKEHRCGIASCQDGTTGNLLKDEDKKTLPLSTCVAQSCDMSKPYFKFCGSPFGCIDDPSVVKTQDGKCKQAICGTNDRLNYQTGQCETFGCKYEERDGKCYKKVY